MIVIDQTKKSQDDLKRVLENRAVAYADGNTGSDIMFAEAVRKQAEADLKRDNGDEAGALLMEAEANTAKTEGINRSEQIKIDNPKP